MLELADKDIKTVITSLFHIKKVHWDMEDIKRTQLKLLEMKTMIHDMKSILDGINNRLNVAQEKLVNLKT